MAQAVLAGLPGGRLEAGPVVGFVTQSSLHAAYRVAASLPDSQPGQGDGAAGHW